MYVFAEFTALMLTNYLIFSFYHFNYVFGEKPHCKVKKDEFSRKEHVGFVRDICVDIIARNLYNMLKISPSSLCEELANIRTSTCSPKCLRVCIKWNRLRIWNIGVTNQVMDKAVALIEDFNEDVWENALLLFDEEKLMFEYIFDAESKLFESKAVTMDSKLTDELRRLRNNFCTRYLLDQNQRSFQERIKKTAAKTMENLNQLVRNVELGTAIKIFIRNYEAKNIVQITNFYLTNDFLHGRSHVLYSLPYLRFEFKLPENPSLIMSNTVFMKIPSLFPSLDSDSITNMCQREALFYDRILPMLYLWGKCNPFAPKPYAITKDNAIVLEDLAVRKYKHADRIDLMNWNQIEKSLELLAKFHALSYLYLQIYGKDDLTMSLIRSFPLSILDGGEHLIYEFYRIAQRLLTPELYEKVKNMKNTIKTQHMTARKEEENSMNVIIHGDYRISNIFFKNNDDGKLMEPMLIDWKLSRETSPAVDLIYFFVTSVPIEIIETHEDILKDFYLKNLNVILRALKIDRFYELYELDNDVTYYKHYYLRVLCINRLQMFNSDDREKEEEAYRESALRWIKYLVEKGIIE